MRKEPKKVNKAVFFGCAAGVFAASAGVLCGAAVSAKALVRLDSSDALKTDGRLIKNNRGETVVLRGVSFGVFQESLLCPDCADDKVRGNNEPFALPAERFGDEKAVELINTCLDNWITAHDLNRLKKLGVNCVRVPFSCRIHQRDISGNRSRKENISIDFSRLDRIVAACGERGIYVIPDLYNTPGCQSGCQSGGRVNAGELFECSLAGLKCRQRTAEIWQAFAKHYKGNPAVAAFDLLSEPADAFTPNGKDNSPLWRFYSKLYKTVQAQDPQRIVMIPGLPDTHSFPGPNNFCRANIVCKLPVDDSTAPEIDSLLKDITGCGCRQTPVFIEYFQAGGILDDALNACNRNALNWCALTYKGFNTQDRNRFLFAAEIDAADSQEDSFEVMKAKWGKLCKTTGAFAENKELTALMKKYLTGAVRVYEDPPVTDEAAAAVELYDAPGHASDTNGGKSGDPFKFVCGTVTLAGMGTLAELTQKKEN